MTPFTRPIDPDLARFLASTARGVAVVAAVFCIAVATLLVANAVQLALMTPLESPSLAKLREQYQKTPTDEFAATIRALDLANRRTWFTRQWQNRTAALMLIAGSALFILCLRAASSLTKLLPKPLPGEGGILRPMSRTTRIALTAVGGVLFVGALSASVLTDRLLPAEPSLAASSTAAGSGFAGPAISQDLLANWPQFRGPGGNGVAGPQDPLTDWDGTSGRNIAWKVEVPLPGKNSPVVWGDRVFLSGGNAGSREVFCWDTATGNLRWRKAIPTTAETSSVAIRFGNDTSLTASDSGWAGSTMAVDGKAVYAVFPTGDLAALDLDGNKVLWSRNLGVPDMNYGYSASLALLGDLLLVQRDEVKGGKLLAIDTASGKDRWRIDRKVTSSWSSPVVADTDEGVRVFLNGTPSLAAYDPSKTPSSAMLWKVDGMMGENAPSPAYADGRVFAANQLLSMVGADAKTGKKLWEVFEDFPTVASPVAGKGFVVMATSDGVITALDPATGNVLVKHEYPKGFWASPIIAGGRLYVMDETGVTRIFTADRSLKLLASPAIGECTVATPAFKGGSIFIRSEDANGHQHLFCIRRPGGSS